MSRYLVAFLRIYKLVFSPILFYMGARCRFEPTCSEYMVQAVQRHGAARGCVLGLKRFCRCHPYGGKAGFDPVPPLTCE
jgi:putative membrane protein insertion efficiency factor